MNRSKSIRNRSKSIRSMLSWQRLVLWMFPIPRTHPRYLKYQPLGVDIHIIALLGVHPIVNSNLGWFLIGVTSLPELFGHFFNNQSGGIGKYRVPGYWGLQLLSQTLISSHSNNLRVQILHASANSDRN